MNSYRRDFRNYPWTLLDTWPSSKPLPLQHIPDLPIKIEYIPEVKFLLRVNVKYREDEITFYHNGDCLLIHRQYTNRKEYGYECYTSGVVMRCIKLPERFDVTKIDAWVSSDGFLHLLAPIARPEDADNDMVVINVPSVNTKTICPVLQKALSSIQEKRYESFFGTEAFKCIPNRNIPQHITRNICPTMMQGNRNVRPDAVIVQAAQKVVPQKAPPVAKPLVNPPPVAKPLVNPPPVAKPLVNPPPVAKPLVNPPPPTQEDKKDTDESGDISPDEMFCMVNINGDNDDNASAECVSPPA